MAAFLLTKAGLGTVCAVGCSETDTLSTCVCSVLYVQELCVGIMENAVP